MTVDGSGDNEQVILATAGYDHTIKVWQTHTGICQRTMQHAESQVNMLEITPDRKLLAAASYQHIRVFDLASNNPSPVINYEGIPKNITCVGFQEKENWMYSGGEDGKVRIWDLRSSANARHYDVSAPISCARLHPNQVDLFIGDQNGNITIWNMKNDYSHTYIPEGDNMILDVAIDQVGGQFAAVNSKGRCYIWNIADSADDDNLAITPKQKFEAHPRQALKCKFSSDLKLLATTSADQTARIWKTSDFTLMQELKHDNQRWVWDAAFSADSQFLFTGSSDTVARLWNVKTGVMEREYAGHQKAITTIAFRDVSN